MTAEHIVDFGIADVSDLNNQSLIKKIGKAPQIFKIYRGHFVPYLHPMSRDAIKHWMNSMAHRVGVREVHEITELTKVIGTLLSSSDGVSMCGIQRK